MCETSQVLHEDQGKHLREVSCNVAQLSTFIDMSVEVSVNCSRPRLAIGFF